MRRTFHRDHRTLLAKREKESVFWEVWLPRKESEARLREAEDSSGLIAVSEVSLLEAEIHQDLLSQSVQLL